MCVLQNDSGFRLLPSVFCPSRHRIMAEEIFAPVVGLYVYEDSQVLAFIDGPRTFVQVIVMIWSSVTSARTP